MRILQNQTNPVVKLSIAAIIAVFGLTVVAGASADGTGAVGKIVKNSGADSKSAPTPTPAPMPLPMPTSTATSAPARKADAAKYEVPGDAEMQEMTRAALLDFNEAVAAGDFTDFRLKTAKAWQKQTTPELYKSVFGEFITKRVDISRIGFSEPIYKPAPAVEMDKGARKLIARGCYDVSPRPVKFVLKWIPEGREWKLFGIEVDTTVGEC